MKKQLFIYLVILLACLQSQAAILHFYSNPRVPQTLFHVTLEYKSYIYEADPRDGGRRLHKSQFHKKSDARIEIPDSLVNEEALYSQLGLPFDFKFIWDNKKTYCSKLVGIALDMEPGPMDFSGTHYIQFYPDWIFRHDLGISPDDVYEFGLANGHLLDN